MKAIKTPERHQLRLSGVFNTNFEHISLLFVSFDFEPRNVSRI